ncbi:hypothetical protein MNBD_BACTEROID01-1478 [hydrothermal vent metagenome]|uniref:Uncharacterized protein n=1 Tax=hydrothermal vent metagenome TaxID=652676 RepID=A0A3B0U0P2_9ZZZZ
MTNVSFARNLSIIKVLFFVSNSAKTDRFVLIWDGLTVLFFYHPASVFLFFVFVKSL